MGLPRDQRMTRPGEYAAVRNHGRTCAGRLLMVALLEKPDLGSARFGFTITRKVGNAVTRNKLRRRLREIAREASDEISATAFVVTIPRFGASTAEFQTLRREWRWAARKLGILPPKTRTAEADAPAAALQKIPLQSGGGRLPPIRRAVSMRAEALPAVAAPMPPPDPP